MRAVGVAADEAILGELLGPFLIIHIRAPAAVNDGDDHLSSTWQESDFHLSLPIIKVVFVDVARALDVLESSRCTDDDHDDTG